MDPTREALLAHTNRYGEDGKYVGPYRVALAPRTSTGHVPPDVRVSNSIARVDAGGVIVHSPVVVQLYAGSQPFSWTKEEMLYVITIDDELLWVNETYQAELREAGA